MDTSVPEWRETQTDDLSLYIEKALQETERWIYAVTGKSFKYVDDPRKSLQNGVLLCELLNGLRPDTIAKINRLPSPIAGIDNLNVFLQCCEKHFGLRDSQLFAPGDLQDLSSRACADSDDQLQIEAERRLRNVLITIFWLGRKLQDSYRGDRLDLTAFAPLLGNQPTLPASHLPAWSDNSPTQRCLSPTSSASSSTTGKDRFIRRTDPEIEERFGSRAADIIRQRNTTTRSLTFGLSQQSSLSFGTPSSERSVVGGTTRTSEGFGVERQNSGSVSANRQDFYCDQPLDREPYGVPSKGSGVFGSLPSQQSAGSAAHFRQASADSGLEQCSVHGSKASQSSECCPLLDESLIHSRDDSYDSLLSDQQQAHHSYSHSDTQVNAQYTKQNEYLQDISQTSVGDSDMPLIHKTSGAPKEFRYSATFDGVYDAHNASGDVGGDLGSSRFGGSAENVCTDRGADGYHRHRLGSTGDGPHNTSSGSLDSGGPKSPAYMAPTGFVGATRVPELKKTAPVVDPLQFIKGGNNKLAEEAQRTVATMEKQKELKKVVQTEDADWQSNLSNWKSKLRRKSAAELKKVTLFEEIEKHQEEEEEARKPPPKTFNEMLADSPRKKGIAALKANYLLDDDDDVFSTSPRNNTNNSEETSQGNPEFSSKFDQFSKSVDTGLTSNANNGEGILHRYDKVSRQDTEPIESSPTKSSPSYNRTSANVIEKTIKITQNPGSNKGFGFTFTGGKEAQSPIIVHKVTLGSAADVCELQTGDEIVSVNGAAVAQHYQDSVRLVLGQAAKLGAVELIVKRRISHDPLFEDSFELEEQLRLSQSLRQNTFSQRPTTPSDEHREEDTLSEGSHDSQPHTPPATPGFQSHQAISRQQKMPSHKQPAEEEREREEVGQGEIDDDEAERERLDRLYGHTFDAPQPTWAKPVEPPRNSYATETMYQKESVTSTQLELPSLTIPGVPSVSKKPTLSPYRLSPKPYQSPTWQGTSMSTPATQQNEDREKDGGEEEEEEEEDEDTDAPPPLPSAPPPVPNWNTFPGAGPPPVGSGPPPTADLSFDELLLPDTDEATLGDVAEGRRETRSGSIDDLDEATQKKLEGVRRKSEFLGLNYAETEEYRKIKEGESRTQSVEGLDHLGPHQESDSPQQKHSPYSTNSGDRSFTLETSLTSQGKTQLNFIVPINQKPVDQSYSMPGRHFDREAELDRMRQWQEEQERLRQEEGARYKQERFEQEQEGLRRQHELDLQRVREAQEAKRKHEEKFLERDRAYQQEMENRKRQQAEERERLNQERQERERQEQEREKQEWERRERERQEKERKEREREEWERQERERKQREERERKELERQEQERREREKQEKERKEREKQEWERQKRERQEWARLEKEKFEGASRPSGQYERSRTEANVQSQFPWQQGADGSPPSDLRTATDVRGKMSDPNRQEVDDRMRERELQLKAMEERLAHEAEQLRLERERLEAERDEQRRNRNLNMSDNRGKQNLDITTSANTSATSPSAYYNSVDSSSYSSKQVDSTNKPRTHDDASLARNRRDMLSKAESVPNLVTPGRERLVSIERKEETMVSDVSFGSTSSLTDPMRLRATLQPGRKGLPIQPKPNIKTELMQTNQTTAVPVSTRNTTTSYGRQAPPSPTQKVGDSGAIQLDRKSLRALNQVPRSRLNDTWAGGPTEGGATGSGDKSQHWLVEEAERRRLAQQSGKERVQNVQQSRPTTSDNQQIYYQPHKSNHQPTHAPTSFQTAQQTSNHQTAQHTNHQTVQQPTSYQNTQPNNIQSKNYHTNQQPINDQTRQHHNVQSGPYTHNQNVHQSSFYNQTLSSSPFSYTQASNAQLSYPSKVQQRPNNLPTQYQPNSSNPAHQMNAQQTSNNSMSRGFTMNPSTEAEPFIAALRQAGVYSTVGHSGTPQQQSGTRDPSPYQRLTRDPNQPKYPAGLYNEKTGYPSDYQQPAQPEIKCGYQGGTSNPRPSRPVPDAIKQALLDRVNSAKSVPRYPPASQQGAHPPTSSAFSRPEQSFPPHQSPKGTQPYLGSNGSRSNPTSPTYGVPRNINSPSSPTKQYQSPFYQGPNRPGNSVGQLLGTTYGGSQQNISGGSLSVAPYHSHPSHSFTYGNTADPSKPPRTYEFDPSVTGGAVSGGRPSGSSNAYPPRCPQSPPPHNYSLSQHHQHYPPQQRPSPHMQQHQTHPYYTPTSPPGAYNSVQNAPTSPAADRSAASDSSDGAPPPPVPPKLLFVSTSGGDTAHHSEQLVSVAGHQRCAHCDRELGQGAAMIIESLQLYYHVYCFRCCVCGAALGTGERGADVRVRLNKLHCHNCYSNDEAGLKYSRV